PPRRDPTECFSSLPPKREREIFARIVAAADGADDVLLAIERVGHRRPRLLLRPEDRADFFPTRPVVRAQHRGATTAPAGRRARARRRRHLRPDRKCSGRRSARCPKRTADPKTPCSAAAATRGSETT